MEEVALTLAIQLAAMADVTVVTTPLDASAPDERGRELVHQLPGQPGAYSQSWMREVAEYCEQARPDAVLGVSAAARRVALNRDRDYPVVMQAHGTSTLEVKRRLHGGGLRGAVGAARGVRGLASDLRVYKRYDTVISISRTVTDSLNSLPRAVAPRSIVEIPNGIAVGSTNRKPQSRPRERTSVLFVGRLHPQKGAHLVLRAVALSGADLIVVGSGGEETRLRELATSLGIDSRVRFIGQIPNPFVREYYVTADVVVAPSLGNEGLPTVALESLNANTPFVTSPAGAAGFSNVPYGVIVSEPTPKAIADAIVEAKNLTREAITLPEEFTVTRSATRYYNLLQQLAYSGSKR